MTAPGGSEVFAGAGVVVIGGGPAGLAAALAARGAGFAVRVLDRRRPPIDKPCGEGLMPDGLAALAELGVRLTERDGAAFRGIRYVDADSCAEGSFPGEPGLGIRRTTLHRRLEKAAVAAGVEIDWQTRVTGLTPGTVATDAGSILCRWTVGADGLLSNVRRWARLEGTATRFRRFGIRRHYRCAPWTDRVEVHWGDGCEAYVTPVAADEVGVALLWSGRKARFDSLLDGLPRLAERLRDAPRSSEDRGVGPLRQSTAAVSRGSVALIGDAAGYLDAITGEGLSIAFHQALALGNALRRSDLTLYRRACRRLARLPNTMTRLLLSVEQRPAVRRRLVALLAERPDLFDKLLAIHTRARPVSSIGLQDALRLGRSLVGPGRTRDGGRSPARSEV